MRLKSRCCRRYERKPRACKRCPFMAGLSSKKRKKTLKAARKLRATAA